MREDQSQQEAVARRRQVLYWRLLTRALGQGEKVQSFDAMAQIITAESGLPPLILDDEIAIETLLQRYPDLSDDFEGLFPPDEEEEEGEGEEVRNSSSTTKGSSTEKSPGKGKGQKAGKGRGGAKGATGEVEGEASGGGTSPFACVGLPPWAGLDEADHPQSLRRALILSKILLNVFGPNASRNVVSANQYAQWTRDVSYFEKAFGYLPGELRGQGGTSQGRLQRRGPGGVGGTEAAGQSARGGGEGAGQGSGGGPAITDEDLRNGLAAMEADIVRRMALREVLKDSKLAAKLKPSMTLVEQLLRDKSNLSGEALNNAKSLIRRYIEELGQILRMEVEQTSTGKIDYSVPPKRIFRNLDLKRTIWRNLINWDAEEQRLYVDRLYYKHTAKNKLPSRMIIVVDQSGSMVDSMVNCTILASIFAGLPNVDAHLVAYDTKAIDLSPWVSDPFEVLLRTNLGGGTEGMVAMEIAREKIANPKKTAMVWISDFYDWEDQKLFSALKAIKQSGARLIPVGSVTSSGYNSINPWFKQRFKELGTPVISGSIKTLIRELKTFIALAEG